MLKNINFCPFPNSLTFGEGYICMWTAGAFIVLYSMVYYSSSEVPDCKSSATDTFKYTRLDWFQGR